MITRRTVVWGISAAVAGSAAMPAVGLVELLQTGSPDSADATCTSVAMKDSCAEAIEDRLSRDIARVAFRADSEEGVPVLLACVNQVADRRTTKVPAAKLSSLNTSVVSEMRQMAPAWEQLRPNCRVSDVARLIQVVAARDFAAGGTERGA